MSIDRMLVPHVLALLLAASTPVSAKAYHSKQSALKLAFPGADRVEAKNIFLSVADVSRIKARCGEAPASKLLRVYVGFKGKTRLGLAMIETFIVRTLPATMMFVIEPRRGSIAAIHVLAFREPREYQPPPRWLAQLKGKDRLAQTVLGRGIAGIAGATLSAQAVSRRARLVMALYRVALLKRLGRR